MGRKKSQYKGDPYFQFTYKMLNSLAVKELAPSSCKSLLFFMAKIKVHNADPQRYKERFTLSYGELKAATGLSDKTIAKVFRELVWYGFISPIKKGGLRGNGKSCSEYKLSTRWQSYGQPGFVEIDLRRFV